MNQHKQNQFSKYLQQIVYGGNDGIVTTFAVVAGFSGASLSGEDIVELSFFTVLLFGLANLFADGVSMGLGNFLSIRADQEVYKNEKTMAKKILRENKHSQTLETQKILEKKGFDKDDAATLTKLYTKNESYWLDWIMDNKLEVLNTPILNPVFTGLATFLAFIFFGFIPLLPFIFGKEDTERAFILAAFFTAIALTLLGLFRWRVSGGNLLKSVLEIVLIGGFSAIVAFTVGVLFRGI